MKYQLCYKIVQMTIDHCMCFIQKIPTENQCLLKQKHPNDK